MVKKKKELYQIRKTLESKGIKETLQSAEYVADNNDSVNEFMEDTESENAIGRAQAVEKLGESTVDEALSQIGSGAAYQYSYENLKTVFGEYFENNTRGLDDTENMDVSNGFFLKMNISGTEVNFNFEGDNATVVNYLPDGKSFEGKEKQLAFAGDVITPDLLRDKLSNEDISSIVQNSNDSQEFQSNLQNFLQDKAREILQEQNTDFIRTEIDYHIQKTGKYTQLLDLYQPQGSFKIYYGNKLLHSQIFDKSTQKKYTGHKKNFINNQTNFIFITQINHNR